jgi:hypothetical protein
MSYLFFDATPNKVFDTYGYGFEGSLGGHLEYLANEAGTPDFWGSSDSESRSVAMNEATKSGLHLYVVDESIHRVVGEVNKPQ